MVDLITIRIQVGLDKRIQFSKKVPQDSTVDDLRQIIRMNQKIDSSDGVVLISNGQSLKNPDLTMADLGICNDSMIICIISKEKGRNIEKLLGGDEEEEHSDIEPVLECEFESRPFGFAVWPNERGNNAIVTKVAGKRALHHNIQIGYCVYKVNDTVVFGWRHEEVLSCLLNTACPLRIVFRDMGNEYTIVFRRKPLGFTVVPDNEMKNARVKKVHIRNLAQMGLKIGSYVVSANDKNLFGMNHEDILKSINNSRFPIKLRFRLLPKLMIVPKRKKNILSKTKKLFAWASR